MASQEYFDNFIPDVTSPESEVLVLPSTYVQRRVKHFTPKSVGSTSSATSSSSATLSLSPCNRLQHLQLQIRNGSIIQNAPRLPEYQENSSSYTILGEVEMLRSSKVSNLSIIYALPGLGSTSLMVSLIVHIQKNNPERWVSYMDLRRVTAFLKKSVGEKIEEDHWTLAKLIIAYNKVTLPSAIKQIEEFFIDSKEDRNKSQIVAELFLDELDELSPYMQEIMLKIISRNVSWKKCRIRLWISSRSHLKSRLQNLFPYANEYELLPLLRSEQIELLANYWKITSCPNVLESKLRNFACGLHDQMEKLIPNFYKTIGACPSHLLQLPDFFTHIVTKLEEDMTENHFSTVDISITKIFEKFVKTKFETYVDRVCCEQPALAMSTSQFREKEFRKLERLHVKTIISCYPLFRCDKKIAFTGHGHPIEQAHELYRVGICYEENGEIRFIHRMYAEFLMAQFFVDSGRLKTTSNIYVSFFLNHVLFDDECKATRKFFDAYYTIQQQERHKIRDIIVWTRLRCFLIRHYRLNSEACANPSSDEDEAADSVIKGKAKISRVTYDDIKSNGSVVHLTIMEGHFKILQVIIDCFKGFPEELKKLLSITVPLEIFKENPFSQPDSKCHPDVHIVDSFQMLAMCGYGSDNIEKLIETWYKYFGEKIMSKYFKDGTFTVIHYAAMNSNCYFLHALLSNANEKKWGRIQVNQRNPEGQQPLHMVLARCWYYSIKIRDHPHPDYKSCTVLATTPSSSSTADALAIQEAIDAVTGTKHRPVVVASSSSSRVTLKRQLEVKSSLPSSKKCKTIIQKTSRRRSSTTHTVKCFKDIWCFEGVEKDFVIEWDSYPEDVEWNPLQPHLATLSQLLESGADINSQDDINGKSILHTACSLESIRLVRFLLDNGADMYLRDDFGKTPAQYAVMNGNMDLLEVLVAQNQNDNRSLNELLNNGSNASMICRIC